MKKLLKISQMVSIMYWLNIRLEQLQGYRNRYNIIDRPSDRCNFCEIKKITDFGTSESNSLNLSKNLKC